jgi:type IV pilus assembly protein PilM
MPLERLLNIGHQPIGVDIGATGVKMLQLRKLGSGFALTAAAQIDLATTIEELQSDEYAPRLAAAIARRAETGGFRGKRCVISIDDRMLRVRSVRHPMMPEAEMDRAVRLDAPNRLGFADGEIGEFAWIHAGEVRQGDEVKEEIVVVGAARDRLEQLVFALVRAGLRPEAVEPGFTACARCYGRTLRRAVDQGVTRVIVDIGDKKTGVMVTRGQSVAFYKPLEMGGDAMTRAAADRLGLEIDAVRDLRRQRAGAAARGQDVADARVDRALFEAVRPLMDELAREVSMCLRYYGVTFRGSRPEACLLVGGEAEEPQLVKLIGDELHIPTSVGRPLAGVEIGPDSSLASGADLARAEWTVAAGLCLRSWQSRFDGKSRRRWTDRLAEVAGPTAARERSAA